MSMVTRCPGCATAFRVQPGQLSARNGKVRCGKCDTVFDGVAALVKEFPPGKTSDDRGKQGEPLPAFMAEPPKPRRTLWWSLIVLAMVALALQAAYHFRAEIAARWPETGAVLEAGCRLLGCELRLPRQARLLSIDSYEVRPDPRREGVIVLSAVIRNRAPFRQEYPALQLTLTDESNRQLVSRAILPREYLEANGAAALIARGIDAGGEAALTVHLDASPTRATGYELVLFYPS
jgi:predicted Zn finger-like uncharacterized protein